MPMPATDAELAAAFARVGLAPDAATRAELLPLLPRLEAMRGLIRAESHPAAEPAFRFGPQPPVMGDACP